MPGDSLKRGSLTSAPVIPAGSGGAGLGANGFTGGAAGDGEGACAGVTAKQAHKNKEAANKRKACTRFIIFYPLMIFSKHILHDPNFGALAAVDIRREIEYFSILPGSGRIEQIFYHHQCTSVVLYHSGQKQAVELCA